MSEELKDLWRQYDKEWAKLMAIPIKERQAYRGAHKTEEQPWGEDTPEAEAIKTKLAELGRAIAPLEKDFEKDFELAVGNLIRSDDDFARLAYASLCNVDWEHEDGSRYSCSWRGAGGFIAEIIGEGDYMDWYCSGEEGRVDGRIEEAMEQLGWHHDASKYEIVA